MNKSKHQLPQSSTEASAGMDLRTNLDGDFVLQAMERVLVPTGLFMEIPIGYEAKIRARGGQASKNGITILNSPGTIDADYRGDVCIILVNLSKENFVIRVGERNYQMVIAKHEQIEWISVVNILSTERGSAGFGHTGNN